MKTPMMLLWLLIAAFMARAQHERLDSLIAAVQNMDDDTAKVLTLCEISYLYSQANTKEGVRFGEDALALAGELRWKKGLADAYNSIGANCMFASDYPNALQNAFNALKYYEEINDRVHAARCIGNIGMVYEELGNYVKALEYYKRGLKMASGNRDKKMIIAASMQCVASAYNNLGKHDSALAYNFNALNLLKEEKDGEWTALVLGTIGTNYVSQKRYDSAMAYYLRALVINRKTDNANGIASNFKNMGALYLQTARDTLGGRPQLFVTSLPQNVRLRKAVDYLDSALEVSTTLGDIDYLQEIHKHLAEAHELSGNYRQALYCQKEFKKYNDSVFTTAGKLKITALETEREVLIRDKQIELDKLAVAKKRNERVFYISGIGALLLMSFYFFRNFRIQKWLNQKLSAEKQKVDERSVELNAALTDLRNTQEQLIHAEKLKENEMIRRRISQDIHDDISAELTKISWLSALAKARFNKKEHEALPELLDKVTAQSGEAVTKLGEIIWTVNPQNDTLGSLLAYVRSYVARFLSDTSFSYVLEFPENGTDIQINPELKRNLFLVIKEALHNAVKYSGAVNLKIACTLHQGTYTFTVADDGIGMGDNVVRGGGNGLRNMQARMAAVNGGCSITSHIGEGTVVLMSGPLY